MPSWKTRSEMQSHYWFDQIQSMPEPAKARQVGDYLAGMTDNIRDLDPQPPV
jgi:dGTP triphosphohydrolase